MDDLSNGVHTTVGAAGAHDADRVGRDARQGVFDHRLDALIDIRNPFDVTPMTDDTVYADMVAEVLADPAIDAAVVGRVQPPEAGRILVGKQSAVPLPTFDRDEITRLFE